MLLRNLILALPVSLAWMILINRIELASFIIGYVIGLALLLLVGPDVRVNPARIPAQLVALVIYAVLLARDIVLSSIDVTRRVLSPQIPLRQGIIAIDQQDDGETDVIAALSAHSITITPGEMVVAFGADDRRMYIHTLDIERSSEAKLNEDQSERLVLLRRIVGRD